MQTIEQLAALLDLFILNLFPLLVFSFAHADPSQMGHCEASLRLWVLAVQIYHLFGSELFLGSVEECGYGLDLLFRFPILHEAELLALCAYGAYLQSEGLYDVWVRWCLLEYYDLSKFFMS